jgi:cytoskeletal protein RodZ
MKSPGTLLKEARESRGLTLVEVAAMTRIPRTLLLHLEQDRFDEMKADVFVRGHLRNYARELGLDSEILVRGYERSAGLANAVESREFRRASVVPERPAKNSKTHWVASIKPTHMFALALVVAAVVLFASLLSGTRATAKDPAQFPQTSGQAWELEQDVQETRWLLERPDTSNR